MNEPERVKTGVNAQHQEIMETARALMRDWSQSGVSVIDIAVALLKARQKGFDDARAKQ
jgi:hypothetical protein